MPPRSEWAAHSADRRVAGVIELERLGAVVDTVAVDVGDPAAMAELMARFGGEWASARWHCARSRRANRSRVGRHAA